MCEQKQHNLGVAKMRDLDNGRPAIEGNTALKLGRGTDVDFGVRSVGRKLRGTVDGRRKQLPPAKPSPKVVELRQAQAITVETPTTSEAQPEEILDTTSASATEVIEAQPVTESTISTGDPARDEYFRNLQRSLRERHGSRPPKKRR